MRRTLILGILLGVLISAVAAFILTATLPSDEEISKISLEELGLDDATTQNPLFASIIETVMRPVQERVRERIIDDVQSSVLLACAGVITVTAVGTTLIAVDSRRRRDDAQP
jgi:hypothetical protein